MLRLHLLVVIMVRASTSVHRANSPHQRRRRAAVICELGIANLATGVVGLFSVLALSFVSPIAFAAIGSPARLITAANDVCINIHSNSVFIDVAILFNWLPAVL